MDRARFEDLAKALAWQLGELRSETWTVASHDYDTAAVLAGGIARLSIGWNSQSAKLRVTGLGPDPAAGRNWLSKSWEIRTDPQRGLLTTAKDINRRILAAGYADDMLVARAKKTARDVKDGERASWLAAAAKLFGIDPPQDTDDIGRNITPKLYLGRFVKGQGYVESYGWGADTGHLSINLSGIPAQVALDMLAVLAKDIEAQVLCCRTYGPAHHPDLALAGCLHRGCDHEEERGEQGSRAAVRDFLESRGVSEIDARLALAEARESRYQVSEIYDDGKIAAVVSWDTAGLGEYTVEVPRETS